MLTESEYILQPVQLSKKTRRTLGSLSHFLSLSLSLSFAPPLAEAGAGQGRVQVLKLSLCVLLPFFFRNFFVFFLMLMERSRRISGPSIVSTPLGSLSFFQLPSLFFIICFSFFTKITEQHQHLFLLKPTPSSAGRPTKTEAGHFLFLSFIRMYASTQTHTHKARIRTPSQSARARFSIAVSLTVSAKWMHCVLPRTSTFLRFIKYLLFFFSRNASSAVSFDLAFAKRCPIKFLAPLSSFFYPPLSLCLSLPYVTLTIVIK